MEHVFVPIGENSTIATEGSIRTFESGATRDSDDGKLDYEGFFSPEVLEVRAKYMHKHRIQSDGNLRDGDNWQLGMPVSAYIKSGLRHMIDLWKCWRKTKKIDVDLACAVMFNLEGLIYSVVSVATTSAATKHEEI